VRTEPRFTKDIDFAVSVAGDPEAEALVHGLQRAGYQLFELVEQRATGRLATGRLRLAGVAGEPLIADLLFASSGIESELVGASTVENIPDVGPVPVATCGHLIALKVLSRDDRERPNDLSDLRALIRVATPLDLGEARSGLALIEQRGFNRGRDLPGLLAAALRELGER